MKPEAVACWRWRPSHGYRSQFGPDTVNTLRAMVERRYPHPHEFICVTDDPTGIDARVRIVPMPDDVLARVPSPHGPKNPSCYRRLHLFRPDAADLFGAERIVSLDLDCVLTDDVTPLWDRPDDFVIWGDYTNPRTPYNGSMMLLTAGCRTRVWTEFDPASSPQKAKSSGFFGSDQGWISYCLGTNEARWQRRDGVYSYRNHLRHARDLPADARIVFFHGAFDPWTPGMTTRHPWVAEHYRGVAA